MKRVALALLLGFGLVMWSAIASLADQMADAIAAYDKGDYATALTIWRPLAEQGNAKARTLLAEMYETGRGVAQDYNEALRWYRLASEKGLAQAQGNLGLMYAQGTGVPHDLVQSYMWFTLAKQGGLGAADQALATLSKSMSPAQIEAAQTLANQWKPTP